MYMAELMTLDELKIRLKIPKNDTSQDEYLKVALEDAIGRRRFAASRETSGRKTRQSLSRKQQSCFDVD
jgi:hypothetical protein